MVMVQKFFMMGKNMLVNTKMVSGMVKEQSRSPMAGSILGNGKMGHIMVKAHSPGQMDESM